MTEKIFAFEKFYTSAPRKLDECTDGTDKCSKLSERSNRRGRPKQAAMQAARGALLRLAETGHEASHS